MSLEKFLPEEFIIQKLVGAPKGGMKHEDLMMAAHMAVAHTLTSPDLTTEECDRKATELITRMLAQMLIQKLSVKEEDRYQVLFPINNTIQFNPITYVRTPN